MNVKKIQFLMSIVFVIGYFILLGSIIFIEASDTLNMKKGDNSMMGEFKILIGVMTGAVAQVLNFWFNKVDNPEVPNSFPTAPISVPQVQTPVTVPVEVPTPVNPAEVA